MAAMVQDKRVYVRHRWCPWCRMCLQQTLITAMVQDKCAYSRNWSLPCYKMCLQQILMAAMAKYNWVDIRHWWCLWCKINVSTAHTDHCHGADLSSVYSRHWSLSWYKINGDRHWWMPWCMINVSTGDTGDCHGSEHHCTSTEHSRHQLSWSKTSKLKLLQIKIYFCHEDIITWNIQRKAMLKADCYV